MSLYSVKVSLKLRAGVAQRPIFAPLPLAGPGVQNLLLELLRGHIFRCFDKRGIMGRLRLSFVSASRDPVLDNRKKDRLRAPNKT